MAVNKEAVNDMLHKPVENYRMRHFIQYHNPDNHGQFKSSKLEGRIVTNKSVDRLVGDTVWLISKENESAQYVLCDSFIVDEIAANNSGKFKNLARGKQGYWFSKPIRIDREPWFEELFAATGHFGFGLQAIRDVTIVHGLESVASNYGRKRERASKS